MVQYFWHNGWLTWATTSMLSMIGIATPGWAQAALPVALPTAESSDAIQPLSTNAQDLGFLELEFPPASGNSPDPQLVGSVHTAEDPNAGLRIPPAFGEGLPIEQVFVYLRTPMGDPAQDGALQQQLADTFGLRAGGNFSPLFADQGLNQVQRLPFVDSAAYRLYESNRPGTVILALLVTLQPEQAEETPPAQPPTGMAVSGRWADFPTIYQSDRSLVKITLNGGLGIFSDSNPWFGNADDFVLNNLGGNPALSALNSRYIGQEFLLTTRYFLSQNFMLQGVGAIAFPGSAIRDAANNDTSPWVTLQLSLFMFF